MEPAAPALPDVRRARHPRRSRHGARRSVAGPGQFGAASPGRPARPGQQGRRRPVHLAAQPGNRFARIRAYPPERVPAALRPGPQADRRRSARIAPAALARAGHLGAARQARSGGSQVAAELHRLSARHHPGHATRRHPPDRVRARQADVRHHPHRLQRAQQQHRRRAPACARPVAYRDPAAVRPRHRRGRACRDHQPGALPVTAPVGDDPAVGAAPRGAHRRRW